MRGSVTPRSSKCAASIQQHAGVASQVVGAARLLVDAGRVPLDGDVGHDEGGGERVVERAAPGDRAGWRSSRVPRWRQHELRNFAAMTDSETYSLLARGERRYLAFDLAT